MPAAAPTFNDSTDPCIGIEIDLVDLEIILEDTIPGAAAAFVAATFSGTTLTKLTLNIDMAEVVAAGGDSWPNNSVDQLIAHEMVHAVMDATMNVLSFEKWFMEGSAVLIPGGDSGLKTAIDTQAGGSTRAKIDNLIDGGGDGDIDAVVAHGNDHVKGQAHVIWLNDGIGGFSKSEFSFGGALNTKNLELVDVDQDGDTDIVTLGYDQFYSEDSDSAYVSTYLPNNKVWLNALISNTSA